MTRISIVGAWCATTMMGAGLFYGADAQTPKAPEPTEAPTVSMAPTGSPKPTVSKSPSMQPSVSSQPSTKPSVSQLPTVSIQPSGIPTVSMDPTGMPSAYPTQTCYDNTTHINEAILRGSDNFRQVFVLCPNTVFNIGVPDRNNRGRCCVDGDAFLMVKSKTTFKCGEDGKAENNCIIRGGDNQFIVGIGGIFSFRVTDILVQGLTFEGPRLTSLLVTAEGDVTFEDCVFRHIKASSPVLSIYEPIPLFNQPGEDKMVIIFRRTTFEYIEQTSGRGGFEIEGIMEMVTIFNSVLLEDCVFRHNSFPGLPQSPSGYAIKLTGASVEIRNTCFYNNTFVGWGAILAFNGSQVTQVNNFAEDPGSVTCDFVAASSLDTPDRRADVSCTVPSAELCVSTGYGNDTTDEPDPPTSASVSFRQGAWCWLLFLGPLALLRAV